MLKNFLKKNFVLILFIFVTTVLVSQNLINTKENTYEIKGDTIFLDSLSVLINSINFKDQNNNPIQLDYDFDFEKSAIILKSNPNIDKINISYKTFPLNFSSPTQLLDKKKFLISDKDVFIKNYNQNYNYNYNANQSIFDNNLESKGSIYRGINVGNNQNAVVNSGMNLQLDGKIAQDLWIKAAITDNNIPIQPDGNTQQLQEFDKMFINIYNDKISLTAADFELQKPYGYFLNYNKKAMGLSFEIKDKIKTKQTQPVDYKASISGAMSKGKFRRQEIRGVEGNQGPYKLIGDNGELYIIVLSGTERVYIDGILQKRGYNNDYTIDYNLGEISFTPQKPINKDKRIIVEFEYSDKNYSRYLITSSNVLNINKTKFWFNLYNESDNKNQPFEQDIDEKTRQVLKNIGDNIDMAYVPSYTFNEKYDNSQIRYKMVDTAINGRIYDSIFVHSSDPNFAFYTVGFALVGTNNGDYIKSVSKANGKVYEWVAPINGVHQGNYAPYKKIITPKLNQMFTLGSESEISDKTKINFEVAYSRFDVNTFSKIDASDDNGFAFKSMLEQDFIKNEKNRFGTKINYAFVHKYFQQIENYRSTEFSRNWNLESLIQNTNENIVSGNLFFQNKNINTSYNFDFLNRWKDFQGLQNSLNYDSKFGTWQIQTNASYLTTQNLLYNTNFLRHNALISKSFKFFTVGIRENAEDNRWKKKETDTLSINSMVFNQVEAFFSTQDTLKYFFNLNYKFRNDKLPQSTFLKNSTNAHDFSFASELKPNIKNTLSTVLTYRRLNILDSLLYSGKVENNLLGKIEYRLKALKGIINSSTYYEIGSGLEQKNEFSYVEVAPGQGVYTWIDYNNNNVQELNEFEIAQFSDQACFLRLITPSSQYVKIYSSQLNQTLNISPTNKIKSKKKAAIFFSKFSDQFIFSVSQKNTSDKIWEYANPFFNDKTGDKLASLTSSLRNSFAFDRNNPKFGLEYVFLRAKNKYLLTQGYENRLNLSQIIMLRYNFNTKIGFQNKTTLGDKSYNSDYFSEKNYTINIKYNETQFNYQPNLTNRISITYNFKYKNNISNIEKLNSNDIGLEYRYNSIKKGTLSVNFNYIYNKFSGETNTSVGYEMLEGLLPGSNFTGTLAFQRQLTNGLVLDLSYNLRKSKDTKMVHIVSAQIRAFF